MEKSIVLYERGNKFEKAYIQTISMGFFATTCSTTSSARLACDLNRDICSSFYGGQLRRKETSWMT